MARSTFNPAIDYVLAHEGGYVNDPKDKGGPTNLGITQATLAAWFGHAVSADDVRHLTRWDATAIYRAEFWDRIRGDLLPAGLDYALFDFAVNSGAGRAARFLQTLLKARGLYAGDIDGGIGAKTLDALRGVNDVPRLVDDLSAMRLKYLRTLDGWGRYGKGWARRVSEVQYAAERLASTQSHVYAFSLPPTKTAPSARGVGGKVAVSRTLPGKAVILSFASAVGEQASEYATTISALQDIALMFKWAFAILTVIGILAGLAKAVQLAQGNGDIPRVPRAARAPDPVGASIEAPATLVEGNVAELPAGTEIPPAAETDPAIVSIQEHDLPELPAEPEPTHVEHAVAAETVAA
jgi:lysozyme family protein